MNTEQDSYFSATPLPASVTTHPFTIHLYNRKYESRVYEYIYASFSSREKQKTTKFRIFNGLSGVYIYDVNGFYETNSFPFAAAHQRLPKR